MTPGHCQACGGSLEERDVEGARRLVCVRCGRITYRNPVPAAGCLVEDAGRVLLIQRGIEPYKGTWCLPSGFVEHGEDVAEAARRETREETGLEVELCGLFAALSYFDDPRQDGILLLYRARVTGGALHAGDDAADARFFRPGELPVERELGFASHRRALADWFAEQVADRSAAEASGTAQLWTTDASPGVTPEIVDADADTYDRFLAEGRGRLRLEVQLANLVEHVPGLSGPDSLRVLDAGGGAGQLAVRLAQLGHAVELVDPSPRMLELAHERAQAAGPKVARRVHTREGSIEALRDAVDDQYDLVLVHNVLEFVADAALGVAALARAVRSGGHVSVLCANRLAEPLAAALRGALPAEVEAAMRQRRFETGLFGGWRNEYAPSELHDLLARAGLVVTATLGVLVHNGLVTELSCASGEEASWLPAELGAGREPAYLGVARYVQCIARKPS